MTSRMPEVGAGPAGAHRPKVLFITGWGRSGSTLLERALGEIEGYVVGGEMRRLWRTAGKEVLCECGATSVDCPFWSQVLARMAERRDLDVRGVVAEVRRARQPLVRFETVPFVLALGPMRARAGRSVARLGAILTDCYRAVDDVAGGTVTIDSSKMPVDAVALACAGMVDLTVVHIVRDPRAVVHSWSLVRGAPAKGGRMQRRHGTLRSSWTWSTRNLLVERFRSLPCTYLRVRYEDLVEDPERVLREVAVAVGVVPATWPVEGHELTLHPAHGLAGNPMRAEVGVVTIRRDDAWRRDMSPRARRTSSVLTAPVARRYGYHLRRADRAQTTGGAV
jgi:hypothetical protein